MVNVRGTVAQLPTTYTRGGVTRPVILSGRLATLAQAAKKVAPVAPVYVSPYSAAQKNQIAAIITKNYKPANLTFAGFSTLNVADYVFIWQHDPLHMAAAESFIRTSMGLPQTKYTEASLVFFNPAEFPNFQGRLQHLAEHPAGSHYHGDFNPGQILSTILKPLGWIGRPLTALYTLGLSEIPVGSKRLGEVTRIEPLVSSNITGGIKTTGAMNKTEELVIGSIFKAGTAIAGIGAATAGTSLSLSGAVSPSTAPLASSTIQGIGVTEASLAAEPAYTFPIAYTSTAPSYVGAGVTASSLGETGGVLSGVLSQVQQTVTPIGKSIGSGLITGGVMTGLQRLGKVGEILSEVLTGNVKGLVNTLTRKAPTTPANPFAGLFGGGGTGGGGGGNIGSLEGSNTWTFIGLGALILLGILYYAKKR